MVVGICFFTGIFLQDHGNVRLMLPEGSSVAAAAQVISKDKVIIGRIRITCIQDHPSTEICQENFKTYQTSCFATMPRPSADAMKHFCKLLCQRLPMLQIWLACTVHLLGLPCQGPGVWILEEIGWNNEELRYIWRDAWNNVENLKKLDERERPFWWLWSEKFKLETSQ